MRCYYEWKRTWEGLCTFLNRFEERMPQACGADTPLDDLNELMKLLRHNRQPDALDALDRMIAAADGATNRCPPAGNLGEGGRGGV